MYDLSWYQYTLIALLFVWSGFVRSGLGFGGAVFALPFLLLVVNDPLIWLPIISIHLLFFSSLTVFHSHQTAVKAGQSSTATIDWSYLGYSLSIMIIPKLIGVFGLVTLNPDVLSSIIFVIIAAYSCSYILNKPFASKSKVIDAVFLMLGGYISGTSLIGAPLIIAVYANHINRHQLRDTMFVLWFILVAIKMAAFIYMDIDLQLIHQLWLLPSAAAGHWLGLRFHQKALQAEPVVFYRGLGVILLLTSLVGLIKVLAN
jgi:uncharacterized membrane protein YfcA